MNFDITKVKDYKNICLSTTKEASCFFSPTLLECNGVFICLTNKTYLITLLMSKVISFKKITENNYTEVYESVKEFMESSGNYGVSISKKDIKSHIGLIVTV